MISSTKIPIDEKSVSKAQQALFGIALGVKRDGKKMSEVPAEYKDEVKKIVDSMTEDEIKKFASTKTKDLPDKVQESIKKDDLVTFMQGSIHRYGRVLSINTSKQTASVEYEHSGEETTDDIPLDKLEVIKKMSENKLYKRMPHLKDLYEFSATPTKMISEADLRKIAEYTNSLGYIASIPNSGNTIYTTTLIAPMAQKAINKFVGDMGLNVDINNGTLSGTLSIYEEGEATLDSTVGRGEFSMGNNPADSSDTTKGSGEIFGDVKKKTNEIKKDFVVGGVYDWDGDNYMYVGFNEMYDSYMFYETSKGEAKPENVSPNDLTMIGKDNIDDVQLKKIS